MSDRVEWIGGGTAGRDHLRPNVSLASDWTAAAIVTDEGDPVDVEMADNRGDGYIFPFGFGAVDFLKYAVRVKKWHLAFAATIVKSVAIDPSPESPHEFEYGSVSIEFDFQFAFIRNDGLAGVGGIIPTREAELVLTPERRYFLFELFDDGTYAYTTRGTYSPNPLIDNISASHTSGFIDSGATNAIVLEYRQDIRFDSGNPFQADQITGDGYGGWIDGDFWPRIQFQVQNSGGSGSRTNWLGMFDDPESVGTLTLLGNSTSIKTDGTIGMPDDYAGIHGFQDMTVAITPVEWWPYSARDGSPIWDSSSGVQLQNPLN